MSLAFALSTVAPLLSVSKRKPCWKEWKEEGKKEQRKGNETKERGRKGRRKEAKEGNNNNKKKGSKEEKEGKNKSPWLSEVHVSIYKVCVNLHTVPLTAKRVKNRDVTIFISAVKNSIFWKKIYL